MAGIIKATGANAGKVVSGSLFNFDDVSTKANSYLEQVRKEATQIVQQAHAEANQIRREAEEKGRQAGMQTGLQTAEKSIQQRVQQALQVELANMVPMLQRTIEELKTSRQEWIAHWERNIVELATAIAQRVIRREVAQTPQIALGLVRESLELATGSKKIRLHLNPRDCETFGEHVRQLTGHIQQLGDVEVVQDPSITIGGCRLTTEFGEIDNQLETQLARISEELA